MPHFLNTRRKDLPAEQRDVLAESHRRAQARYREKNRDLLNVHACKYRYVNVVTCILDESSIPRHRIQKKAQKAILDDEEEYQRLWALAGEELEGIR